MSLQESNLIPKLATYGLGGLFLLAGASKMLNPQVASDTIRGTRFYDLATKVGIPLAQGNNLNLFTTGLGALMALAGAGFAGNYKRYESAGVMGALLMLFNVFVHTKLDNPLKTPPKDVVAHAVNVGMATCILALGGWLNKCAWIPMVLRQDAILAANAAAAAVKK